VNGAFRRFLTLMLVMALALAPQTFGLFAIKASALNLFVQAYGSSTIERAYDSAAQQTCRR
jgi:hypothetical protein